MNDLNDLQYFAAVIDYNGFSAAGRALSLPKSSISRRIDRLETRLGVRLLERSTRAMRLTEIGAAYYARCKAMLAEIDAAEQDLAVLRGDPVGTIRISCPTGLAQFALARIVAEFMGGYPLVRVQVTATNRAVDIIEEPIDVAIRARAHLHDEALTMRRLGTNTLVFVASPDFAAAHSEVTALDVLARLPFLSFLDNVSRPSGTFIGPGGARQTSTFVPVLWANDFNIIIAAARAGRGFALLPGEVAERSFADGSLVRLLPQWHSEDVTIHAVFATRRGATPALRAFIDYLATHFESAWRGAPAPKY